MADRTQHDEAEVQEEITTDGAESEAAPETEWVFDPNGDYSDYEKEILRAMGHQFPGDAEPASKPAAEKKPKEPKAEKPIIPLDAVEVPAEIKPIRGKSVEEVLSAIPDDQRADVLAIIKGIQASATKINQAKARVAMPAAKEVPQEFDALDPKSVDDYIQARINEGIRSALAPIEVEQQNAELEAEFNAFIEANPLMKDDAVVAEVVELMEKMPSLSMEDAFTRVENKRLKAEREAAARKASARKAAAASASGTRPAARDEDYDEDGIPVGMVGNKNFDLLGHIMARSRRG